MVITGSSGYVGIGKTNPGYPLDVVGNMRTSGYMVLGNSGDIRDMGTHKQRFKVTSTDAHVLTNSTERITVDFSGDVGIGTTTPTEKLQVTGDISASGDVHLQHLQLDHFNNDIFFGTDSSNNKLSYNYWKQSATGGTTIHNTAGAINLNSGGHLVTVNNGNVTASGNISASGDITLDTTLNFGATTGEIKTTNPNGSGNINIIQMVH